MILDDVPDVDNMKEDLIIPEEDIITETVIYFTAKTKCAGSF